MPRCAILWHLDSKPSGYHQTDTVARALKQVANSLGSTGAPALFSAFAGGFDSLNVFDADELRAELGGEGAQLRPFPTAKADTQIERAISCEILSFALSLAAIDRVERPVLVLVVPDPTAFVGSIEVLRSHLFRVVLILDRTRASAFATHADKLVSWDRVMHSYLSGDTSALALDSPLSSPTLSKAALSEGATDDSSASEFRGLTQALSTQHRNTGASILAPLSLTSPSGIPVSSNGLGYNYRPERQASSSSADNMFNLGAIDASFTSSPETSRDTQFTTDEEGDDSGLIWGSPGAAKSDKSTSRAAVIGSAAWHARLDQVSLPSEEAEDNSLHSNWDDSSVAESITTAAAAGASGGWSEALRNIASSQASAATTTRPGATTRRHTVEVQPATQPPAVTKPASPSAMTNGQKTRSVSLSLHAHASTSTASSSSLESPKTARPAAPPPNAWVTPGPKKGAAYARKRDELFAPLLKAIVVATRAEGTIRVTRGRVGSEIKKVDPNFYEKMPEGIDTFGEYARAAERAGKVVLEGNLRDGWIKLAPVSTGQSVVGLPTSHAGATLDARALKSAGAKGKGPGRAC